MSQLKTQYHPRIGRCQSCAMRESDCTRLPFHDMPVHRRDGVDVVVTCTRYFPASGQFQTEEA